mgnify:CR=1 FL=1
MPNFFDDPDLYKTLPTSLTGEFLNADLLNTDLLKLGKIHTTYLMLPAGMSCKIAINDYARIPIFGGPFGGTDGNLEWLAKNTDYQLRTLLISSALGVSYRVIIQHIEASLDDAVDLSIIAQLFTRAILKTYELDPSDDRRLLATLHREIEVLKASLRDKP